MGAAGLWLGVEIPELTRDPTAVAGVGPLTGGLSSIGVLLWAASAAIWLFSAWLLRERGSPADARFALGTGLFTAYLVLDDLFLLHEELAPRHLGIDEDVFVGLLVVLASVYLILFRRRVFRRDALLLHFAFALFAGSLFLDAVLEPRYWPDGNWVYLVEDGLKWLGIACWAGYCVTWCGSRVLETRDASGTPGSRRSCVEPRRRPNSRQGG